ncbi:maltose O-acetyltransferase [Klenkia brasiliensis]|uniref:Maltose O-acetyltransferase n=2 Tax=Klenkia brasiliensis TaxID=333142 RepID=A0A1G7MQV8_9ACTN|nr:maltose O-acetyltransferase [Klenkia brasiliensis]
MWPVWPVVLRRRLLVAAGLQLAPTVDVKDRVRFVRRNVSVGDGTRINRYSYFEDHAGVHIGREVSVAAHCKVLTTTHTLGPAARRAGPLEERPVRIGDGCWLGTGVTVLAGVTIGDGCVVAAGSVVTSDCEPHGLYAGVPARRKKDLLPARESAAAGQ